MKKMRKFNFLNELFIEIGVFWSGVSDCLVACITHALWKLCLRKHCGIAFRLAHLGVQKSLLKSYLLLFYLFCST